MKQYDLVICYELAELISTVNEAISQGYIPIGGILETGGKYIQAIFKIQ